MSLEIIIQNAERKHHILFFYYHILSHNITKSQNFMLKVFEQKFVFSFLSAKKIHVSLCKLPLFVTDFSQI